MSRKKRLTLCVLVIPVLALGACSPRRTSAATRKDASTPARPRHATRGLPTWEASARRFRRQAGNAYWQKFNNFQPFFSVMGPAGSWVSSLSSRYFIYSGRLRFVRIKHRKAGQRLGLGRVSLVLPSAWRAALARHRGNRRHGGTDWFKVKLPGDKGGFVLRIRSPGLWRARAAERRRHVRPFLERAILAASTSPMDLIPAAVDRTAPPRPWQVDLAEKIHERLQTKMELLGAKDCFYSHYAFAFLAPVWAQVNQPDKHEDFLATICGPNGRWAGQLFFTFGIATPAPVADKVCERVIAGLSVLPPSGRKTQRTLGTVAHGAGAASVVPPSIAVAVAGVDWTRDTDVAGHHGTRAAARAELNIVLHVYGTDTRGAFGYSGVVVEEAGDNLGGNLKLAVGKHSAHHDGPPTARKLGLRASGSCVGPNGFNLALHFRNAPSAVSRINVLRGHFTLIAAKRLRSVIFHLSDLLAPDGVAKSAALAKAHITVTWMGPAFAVTFSRPGDARALRGVAVTSASGQNLIAAPRIAQRRAKSVIWTITGALRYIYLLKRPFGLGDRVELTIATGTREVAVPFDIRGIRLP